VMESKEHGNFKLAHAPEGVKGEPIRFAVDCMLGRLARWLRILGHDAAYFHKIEDADLVKLALRERRVLLTRDTRLVRRRAARTALLIRSHLLEEQLQEVGRWKPEALRAPKLGRRCLVCNEATLSVEKASVRTRVPAYVYHTQSRFLRCPSCDRIYWRATHVADMLRRLRQGGTVDRDGP
jgi:uncharacterized protein with PIN domain